MAIIVSAYYKIPSKRGHNEYIGYLRRFFEYLAGHTIVFFCSQEVKDELFAFGNVNFVVKEFIDLEILHKFPTLFWDKQKMLDVEPYHTAELGIVWASKKEFLACAKDMYPENDWFLWADAGCIRMDAWKPFCPGLGSRRQLEPGVYLQTLCDLPKGRVFFTYPDQFIAGGLIYAHKDYISLFSAAYDRMLLKYDAADVAAIMDQYILASLVASRKEESYLKTIQCIDCPDKWFFFLAYL